MSPHRREDTQSQRSRDRGDARPFLRAAVEANHPGGSPDPAPLLGTSQAVRLRTELPRWRSVLVVVAHPDDETFGLGAVISHMIERGTAVHVLCFTHGESSTLGDTTDLYALREGELREASARLGVRSVTLLTYPDGRLADTSISELSRQVAQHVARVRPEALLVFDDSGVTAHPDHQAATRAAVHAHANLPVLAWALPAVIADRLRRETGQPFVGREPDELDLCLRVARVPQRRSAYAHASQLSPTAVFWRRVQLQGECEHLRWLRRPAVDQGNSQRAAKASLSGL